MTQDNICLFLTGTITPRNVPDLERANAKEREKDYATAVEKWSRLGFSIVFCENSQTDSVMIKQILESSGVQYEYLSFQTTASHMGKGHGEVEIFDYAFENSNLLKKAVWICKVTGRYFVGNGKTIIDRLSNLEKDIVTANLSRNLTWADSRFFAFRPTFYYKFLESSAKQINDKEGVFFENILAKAILSALIENYKWKLFSTYPIYEGIYGTKNVEYSNSFFSILKYKIFFFLKRWIFQHTV